MSSKCNKLDLHKIFNTKLIKTIMVNLKQCIRYAYRADKGRYLHDHRADKPHYLRDRHADSQYCTKKQKIVGFLCVTEKLGVCLESLHM